MIKKRTRAEFDRLMLPHLGDAYNLARWLLRHKQDAEDAVQQSYLKAFKAFDQYLGGDSAAWIFRIVRNTCMSMLGKRSRGANIISIDNVKDAREQQVLTEALQDLKNTPEVDLLDQENMQAVWQSINALPAEFREIIILREFAGMSYQEISETIDIPIGTVMSRLSRAREQLRQQLSSFVKEHKKYEL